LILKNKETFIINARGGLLNHSQDASENGDSRMKNSINKYEYLGVFSAKSFALL